jgi:HK97 family phage major capsid protein
MPKRKSSADIVAEQAALRVELATLEKLDEPTDEQVTRSAAIVDEFERLDGERETAIAFEKRLDVVRSKHLDAFNREPGTAGVDKDDDGDQGDVKRSKRYGNGPQVMNRVKPFEGLDMVRAGRVPDGDLISRARAAVEQAPEHMNDKGREHVDTLLRLDRPRQTPGIARHLLMTGSPEYHQEFTEFMSNGYVGPLLRAAMTLTDANGGYLVPFTLDPTIILTNTGITGNIRSLARNIQIVTDNWNGVTSDGVTAEWTAEAAEAADASPGFANIQITPKRADAWVQGSYEVLADSGFASELGRLVADAKVRHEEAAFATGNTGATKPRGIVAAVAAVTAQIVTSATTGAYVVGDVYNLQDAVDPRWEDNAVFLANKKILTKTRQFDTAGGSAFWANLGMRTPPLLLGAEAYKNSTMTGTIAAGANILLCGDMQEYAVVDRIGMSIAYEPMVKGANRRPTGEAGWFAFWRVGADVLNVKAFRLLQLNQIAAATALA